MWSRGAVKDVHVRARALHSSGNIELIGAVTGITARKATAETIREQELELRQILDFTPQLIAVYGPSFQRLYVNRSALEYMGLTLEEWRQTAARGAFVHPDDRALERTHSDRQSAYTWPRSFQMARGLLPIKLIKGAKLMKAVVMHDHGDPDVLEDEDQLVSLSDFRGRPVILAFYPADWSPVCGDQMALYNELLDEFARFDAELRGISVDVRFDDSWDPDTLTEALLAVARRSR